MNAQRLERFQRRLFAGTPLVGRWRRQRAAAVLVRDGSPPAVRALAEAIVRTRDLRAQRSMLRVLGHLDPSCQHSINAVCATWARTRHPGLGALLTERSWVASAPTDIKVLSALHTGHVEELTTSGAKILEPLLRASQDADPIIAQRARARLLDLRNAEAIDAVCARWTKLRQPLVAEIIAQAGYVARHPPGVRVLSALHAGRVEAITTGGAEVVEPLLRACEDEDPTIAGRAASALQHLTNSDAQDALCQFFLTQNHPRAREIALAAQYTPREPHQRALFYFLTDQWEKYEPLDFDHTLLRAAYEVGDAGLRRRIAEKARQAGRVEWVEIVTRERRGRRLEEMTAAEWEAALAVLVGCQRWEEMWRLVSVAPPNWSAQVLGRLNDTHWAPAQQEEQRGFMELTRLAQAYGEPKPELGGLVRCRATLEGHASPVMCLAITPDGRVLASGGTDGNVRLWRLPSGEALTTLAGHTDWIYCLAISPDGGTLASGSEDASVRLWRLPSGEALATLRGHTHRIQSLAISPNGALLASGSEDGTVRLWTLSDGRAVTTLDGQCGWVRSLAISPQGTFLASGSEDAMVRLWRLPDGEPLTTLSGHTAPVRCLVVTPDGRLLVSGSWDGTVRVWSLPDGVAAITLHGHKDEVTHVAISPDGRMLATGGADKAVRVWSLPDGESLITLHGHTSWVRCLAISPDGRLLVSGSWGGSVGLWRLADGQPVAMLHGHGGWVWCVAVSPDASMLASGSEDGTVRLWTSDVVRLSNYPIARTSPEDLEWVQEALQNPHIADAERRWLEFVLALMRWRRRFDIEVIAAVRQIGVRAFDDIEIEV